MGMKQEEAEKRRVDSWNKLGLSGHADAYPFSLSGGQKQRVALARAMMIDPEIIGYDEPTSALDPELRLEVEKLILQNRELGMTQIVVTHDLQFAENIADQILKVEPKWEVPMKKRNCFGIGFFLTLFLTACTQKAADPNQDNWAKYQKAGDHYYWF